MLLESCFGRLNPWKGSKGKGLHCLIYKWRVTFQHAVCWGFGHLLVITDANCECRHQFALGSLHRVTAKDCWWLVDIPSSAGRVKYLQLVSTGWKTSVAIFNLSVATLAGWSRPWPWLSTTFMIFSWWACHFSLPPVHTQSRGQAGVRKDGFASACSLRAPEWPSSKGLCLETAFIAHTGSPGPRGMCSRSQS